MTSLFKKKTKTKQNKQNKQEKHKQTNKKKKPYITDLVRQEADTDYQKKSDFYWRLSRKWNETQNYRKSHIIFAHIFSLYKGITRNRRR